MLSSHLTPWRNATLAVMLGLMLLALTAGCLRGRAAETGTNLAPGGASPMAAPKSRLSTGPYAVTELVDFTVADVDRGKALPCTAYFPEPAGRYPLIIFSHGAGGDQSVGPELMRYWASFGFVVLCPTHQDSLKLRWAQGERPGMRDTIRSFGQDPEFRQSRVEDDKLLIDCAINQSGLPAEVLERIDTKHIGVGGHSAGAMTASLLAGARAKLPGTNEFPDASDARIAGALLLSGQGKGGAGFTDESWQTMTLPVMVMTGSEDTAANTAQTPATRRQPYELAPAGDKYLVFIDGARHMSFVGKAAEIAREYFATGSASRQTKREMQMLGLTLDQLAAVDQEGIFDDVKQASLEFWLAYLAQDQAAYAWLQSGELAAASTVPVEYERK